SHGYRIPHRPSADRRHPFARRSVLRLDGGFSGRDGDDRADRDGAGIHYCLYAAGGTRALAADAVDGGWHDTVHLRAVRPSTCNPMAANPDRRLAAGVEGDPRRLERSVRVSNHIDIFVQPRPEERALARVSKDGHKRSRTRAILRDAVLRAAPQD